MTLALFIVLLAGCGVLSALLSALETVLSSLREHHLERLSASEERPRTRAAVELIRSHPYRSLHAILILSAAVNLAVAVLCLYGLLFYFGRWDMLNWVTVGSAFLALVLLVDVIPKAVALSNPRGTLRLLAGFTLAAAPPLMPVAGRLESVCERIVQRITPARLQRRAFLTGDELETWIEMRRDLGTLADSESEIIQEIIRLGSKTAKDCMTPRVDVYVLADDLEPAEARRLVMRQPHWNIPVYHDEPDAISGILDVKAFLLDHADADYREFVRPPVFVPETMRAIDLFRSYLVEPHSIAIVLDEYGGFEGIATHADIIEEIIADAVPQLGQEEEIQHLGGQRLLVSGSARLDEISDELGVDLEADGLDTVGGLIFTRLTYLPEPGEQVVFSEAGVVATVRKCSRNRIEEVLLESGEVCADFAGDAGGEPAVESEASAPASSAGDASLPPPSPRP